MCGTSVKNLFDRGVFEAEVAEVLLIIKQIEIFRQSGKFAQLSQG